jgi:hypothetical protein
MIDEAGNLHWDRRTSTTKTLFVAHTDTMARAPGRQNLVTWEKGRASVTEDVLGADNGAGLALMLNMLEKGVPGYYIATRGEEIGGVGSAFLVARWPHLLSQFDRAITFDRAGYDSIITHQSGERCCSEAFAQDLAVKLSALDDSFVYFPDETGVFTDTKLYVDLIPNCTNISVGYFKQHGKNETLDLSFWEKLAEAALKLDWESLDTSPREQEGAEEFDEDVLNLLDVCDLRDYSNFAWEIATAVNADYEEALASELSFEVAEDLVFQGEKRLSAIAREVWKRRGKKFQ